MNHYIMSGDGTVNVFACGKPFNICPDALNYVRILDLVKTNLQDGDFVNKIEHLINNNVAVGTFTQGKVSVDLDKGIVEYDGVQYPGKGFCERIIRLAREGQDFEYLIKFLDNMCANPSFRSAMQLFVFIQKEGFPITERGTILGYKGVRSDYYDRHSGTIKNFVGATISIDRSKVCADHTQGCAAGLHVGSHSYASQWATSDGRVLLVEVNPKDVVSVPSCEVDKMRCCEYRVVADHTGGNILKGEVYDSNTGTHIQPAGYLPHFEEAQRWDEEHTYGDYDYSDDEEEFEDDYDYYN